MEKLEFDVGFKEDGSLQSLIDHVQKAKQVLTDTGSAEILEKSGIGSEQLTAINEMLSGSLTMLEGLSTEMANIPRYMQTASFGLKTELESMYNLVNKIGTSYQKINSSEISKLDTARKMMALSASIQSNVGTMQEARTLTTAAKNVRNFSRETFGFQNYETFQQLAPEIAMQRLNPLVQRMMNANRRGFTNVDSVVNQVMGDSSFTTFYRDLGKKFGTEYLTDTQIRNGVLAILGQHSMYGQQLNTSQTLKTLQAKGILKTPETTDRFIQDRLSNEHQIRSFNTYGHDKKTDEAALAFLNARSDNGDPIRQIDKKHRKSSGLQELYNYLKQGNNMGDLFPLLKEAGIASAPIGSGSYHLNSKIHESQLQYLAARAVQKYRDALASEAPYEIDPTDYFNTEKTLGRQGKKPQLYGGLLRALPNDVVPSLNTYDPSKPFTDVGRSYNTHIQFDKTPSFDRYYIPSTKFDAQTGNLVERNVNWRKDLSKGIEKRKSDEYVAITDSLISRIFGMEGNGTLGYGRDKDTGAIIRYIQDPNNPDKRIAAPPSLISVDFSQFLKEDENNPGLVKPDTKHPMYQQAADYLAGKRLLKYGNKNYHYLYQDDEGGAVFGLNDIYEREVKRYEELGLRHPFQAGNEGDMLFGGDRKKFTKQTNTLKKLSSSAVPLEDLYDGLEVLKTEAPIFANFSMLYDMIDEMNGTDEWGKDSGKRMNGQVWGDPKLFKKSMQMRFGMGTDKFMMSGVDWRPMLKQGWSAGNALNPNIFGKDENGNIGVYVPGGHMSTDEDYAAVKSFITGNKYQVVDGKIQLATDNTGAPIPLTTDELLKIRNERMVNLLGKGPVLMDREAMKSESGYRNLSIEKFRTQFGQEALDEAIAQGRQEGNTIRLTSAQSAMDMLRYSRSWDHGWDKENGGVGKYSGYFAMKNDRDMESSKEYLPESLLRAINAPASVFENSERRYRERLAELDTMSGRIKQFEGDENAMAEIRKNPRWVFESQTAIQHIASTRNTLLKNRALNKVIMDENREGTVGTDTVGEIAELFMGLVPGLKPTAFGKFQALLPSVMDKANAVYAPGLSEEDISMMLRFPIATRQLALNVKNYAQSKEGKRYLKNIKTVQSLDSEISDAEGGIKTQDQLIEHYNSLLSDPNITKENSNKINKQIENANKIKEKLSKQNELRESLRDTLNDEILTQEKVADENPDSPVAFIRARRLTGQDPLDVATTMSASMMYQFNTGDFDGDTIYAFYKMSEEAMRNAEEENKAFDAYKKGQKNAQQAAEKQSKIAQESEPVTSVGTGRLEVMAQSINSKQAMASASAALRKAQTANPNDPYRVAGLVEAMEAYDKATSDVKTKGLEATMGEYAKMYLTSQGQHYERFVKALYENENEDEPYGKKLFGVSFASKFDPEGLMALAIRRDNSLQLGQTDVRSLELMEKWYQDNYGADTSKEAEAARFMLDRLEDSQIFGKIWTDKDSQRGWKKYDAWLKEVEAKASRGKNVDEDMAKLNQFRKRLEEQDSGDFVNEKVVREELAKYQQLYSQTGDETFKKYAGYLQRYLPLDEKAETKREEDISKDVTDVSIAQMRRERAARVKEIRGMMDTANEEADLANRLQYRRTQAVKDAFNPELMGDTGRISPYNWSSVKHYIGYKNNENAVVAMPDSSALEILNLRGALGPDGKISDTAFERNVTGKTVKYNEFQSIRDAQVDMIKMLSGEERDTSAYKNEWTHIGQLMHSAFEEYFDPSKKSINPLKETPDTQEERIEATRQAFRDMLLGKRDNGERMDRAALADLGLKITEDEKTGNLIATSSRLTTQKKDELQQRINNLVGYTTENGQKVEGTIESFLKVMGAYANEGDRTFSIEDKLYDAAGNLLDARYGGNVWKQVVTDKEGNIIRTDHSLDKGGFAPVAEGETSHVFLTHAKPDLVRQDKDGNLLLYDYKSGGEGAFESLLQSAFYSDMLFDLGRKAWQNPDDSRYEPYKPWAKEVVNENGEKEYVSTVKKVVGINPRGEGQAIGIDLTTAEGKKWAADQLLRVNDAFLSLESLGRAENPLPEGMSELINAAKTYSTVQGEVEAAQKKASEMFADGKNKNLADYFLSTFASQREQFANLEKEVNKDYYKYNQNLDIAGMSRFSLREAEISKLFDEKVTAAYLANNGDDEAIDAEIRKIKTDKINALQRNSETARLAATQDIKDAQTSIGQMFKGVEPTTEADIVIGAFQKLARAKQQKDYLRENKEYYDPFYKNEKGEVVGRFLTEGNDDRAQEAQARKDAYEEAVRLGEEADAFLLKEAGAYVSRYTKKDSRRIQNMIKAEPLDASEKFNEFVQQQAEDLQKEIDTYNETVNKLTDQQKKTNDPKKQMLLQELIDHANEQKDALEGYLKKSGHLDKAIKDERERLGITSKTTEQRADDWYNERVRLIDGSIEREELHKRRGALNDAVASGDQLRIQEAAKAYATAQQRYDDWVKTYGGDSEAQKETLAIKRDALFDAWKYEENQPFNDFMNKVREESLSPGARARHQLNDLYSYVAKQSENTSLSGDVRQKWTDLLLNDDFWADQFGRLVTENENAEMLTKAQRQYELDAVRQQNEMADRQRQHAYERQNKNLWGSPHSRYINAYRQQQEQRFALETTVKDTTGKRDLLQKNIEKREEAFKNKYHISSDKYAGTNEQALKEAHSIAVANEKIKEYNKTIQDAQEQSKKFNKAIMPVRAGFTAVGESMNMMLSRFGRQMFYKVINEVKQFVKEFDKSMTSIQMITLKSDSQMSQLGNGLISKAKDLKVSISDITKSAETLYRQGLTDEEVDERLEVVSKFSKVSGTKVDAATKLITVAMNTGLVDNAQQAADIVTALGDNAATNASEIEKGIEKAGAAAAADGTTFSELSSMLTAITSTTQIGGNVAGRTLNTIFGRMNKIGTDEIIYDENGYAVSGSAVSRLLEAQGVKTYENGKKRSSFDVLYDLSKVWDSLDDATQQQLATQIAGTRQYSNFAAIMQGMSEGKVDEYMKLARESGGIVDEKYQIYLESLEASLTNVKNTFDELVHNLTENGTLTGILDFISNMIKGLDNLANSAGGLAGVLEGILPMLIALTMMKSGNLPMMLGGLALGIGASSWLGNLGKQEKSLSSAESLQQRVENFKEVQEARTGMVDRAEELYKKGSDRTEIETSELKQLAMQLSEFTGLDVDLDSLSSSSQDAASGLDGLSDSLDGTGEAVDEFSEVVKAARQKIKDEEAQEKVSRAGNVASAISEGITQFNEEYKQSETSIANHPELFTVMHDNASGTYIVTNGVSDMSEKEIEEYATGYSNGQLGMAKVRGISDATGIDAIEYYKGINSFLRASKTADYSFNGPYGGAKDVMAVWNWLRTFLGEEPISFSQSDLAYAINGKPYEENVEDYAKLFSEYTMMLGKDSGSPYAGWGVKDWKAELKRVGNGESMIPKSFLNDVSDYYSRTYLDTDAYSKQKQQVKQLFRNQLSSMVEPEYLDAIVERATNEYYAATPNLDPYEMPDANNEAIAQIIKDINGTSNPYDVSADVLRHNHQAYASGQTTGEIDKELTKFITDNPIVEIANPEQEKQFNDKVREYASTAIQSTKTQTYKMPTGERITKDELPGALDMLDQLGYLIGYAYTDRKGMLYEDLDLEEADDLRYRDFVHEVMIPAAKKDKQYSRILRENRGDYQAQQDALAEWYFTNHPEYTYEDYTRPGPVLQKPIYEEDTYFVNGKPYTDAEKAYEENVDYFKELYSKENPVENVGTKYKFGDTLYDTEELAQEAQTAAFYEEQSKNAPSLFGSNVYSFAESWRSDKSSMTKASANDFIRNLQEKGITSFSALKEAVDNKSITGFTTLLSANPALAEKLKEVVSFENGEYSIKAGADENFWNEFLTTVAQASKDYADVNLVTRQSAATNALAAFNEYAEGKLLTPDTIAGHDDLKTILGSNLYGKWASGTLSPKEQEYSKLKIENYRTGSDITARQKAVLSAGLFKDIEEGNDLTEYTKMDDKTLSDYLSGISGVSDIYQMALALKEYGEKENVKGFTFKEAVAGIRENGEAITDKEINNAFDGRYTASDLRALNLTVSQAAELEKYKNTPQEKEISSLYSGLTSLRETERLSTVQSSMSSSDKLGRARTALERLDTSKTFEELDEAVVDELVSATGYTKDQIKKMWKSNRAGTKATLQAQIDAQKADLDSVYSAVINSYTAGFEELKFDENVSLSTDELADILQSVEGFDKSVIAWIRAVGASVENGQYVFNEGSEQIGQTLRETTDSSKQNKENKEAALKQIEDIMSGKTFEDRFYGIQSFLDQDTDIAKSISGTDLAYLLNGYGRAGTGVTEEDIRTAIQNERFGINNPFIRNAYSIRRLFGSTDISRWNGATARSTYEHLAPDIRNRIDSMLGDFGDGMKQYLNGELDNWEEAIKPFAEQKYLSELGTYDKETRERMAKYKADFAYGSDSERKAVIDYYQQGQKDILGVTDAFGQYGAIPSKKDEQAEVIANFLPDWTKESVKEVLEGTDQDKKDQLAKDIQDQISDYFDELSKVLQLDIDPSDLSSAMEELTNALNDVENNASEIIKQLIEELNIDWLVPEDKKPELDRLTEEYQTSQASKSKIKDIVDKIESGDYTSLSDLYGPGKTFKDKTELSSFLETSGNSQFNERIAEINSREDQTFTEQDIAALRNASVYGGIETNPDITAQYREFESLINENGGLNVEGFFDKLSDADFKEWVSGLEWLNEALDDLQGTTDGTGESLKRLKTEALADYYDGINAFGDATKEVTDAMRQSNGTLKEQNALMEKYRKAVRSSADATNAVKRWKDKKPTTQDKALIESLGFSKENIRKALSKDAKDIGPALYDEIMRALENNANAEDTAANIGKGILGGDAGLNEDIAEYVRSHMGENGEITIDAPGIKVEGGTVTIDDSALLSQFSGGMSSITADLLAAATAAGGSATATVTMDGNNVNVTWSFSPGSKAGGSGGGGGGGGGKSEADKLIEKLKHKTDEAQHNLKMSEEYGKRYDLREDYDAKDQNITEQIGLQRSLIDVYRSNISELETMMSKTKQGSDDWYKLRDAIYAAKEELEAANTAIEQLKVDQVQNLVEKISKENKFTTHEHNYNMRDKYASRALTEDRFADWLAEKTASIGDLEKERASKTETVKSLKKRLGGLEKTEENKAEREEIIKQIEQAEEEGADLDNQIAETKADIQSQQLSQVANKLSQNTQAANHNLSIAGTWASSYQASGYRDDYENMLKRQITESDTIIDENEKTIEETKKLQEGVEKGSTAWFEYQATIDECSETIAEAKTNQIEYNRALQESGIEKITEEYEDATREISHVNTMLKNFAQNALQRNDYVTYFASMDEYLKNLPDKIEKAKKKLADLKKMYEEGMAKGTLDPATQRQLEQDILDAEAEVQDLELDKQQTKNEVVKQRINQTTQRQDWEASNYEHNLKQLGYQTSTYQNNGELTNYNSALQEDTKLRTARIDTLNEEKAELEELLEITEKGSNEEKQVLEAIKKKDEAIASENAQIQKNSKLIEENTKKIVQLRKALLDSMDKEIEAGKKREREMLSGTVSLQNSILDVIKKRYQDQWNLQKKDIEKEKESLNEYKKLLNDRLNYRKKAMQQADKQEEIAELNKQIALLSADPTRSKDLKEVTRKRDELLKEQSLTIAEDEVAAESERIDDQIEGMDKFVQYNEELLNEMLGDANNFADEVNGILSGTFEESYQNFLDFMARENESFMKSLPETQRQLMNTWMDTFKKAKDIVDNNYAQINDAIGIYDENGNLKSYDELSKDSYRASYIEWMKKNDRQYRSEAEAGNETGMKYLENQWNTTFDSFLNSLKDDFSFKAEDFEWGIPDDQLKALEDNTYKVDLQGINLEGGKKTDAEGFNESDTKTQDFSDPEGKNLYTPEDLDAIFKEIVKKVTQKEEETKNNTTGNSGSTNKKYYVYGAKGEEIGTIWASSESEARRLATNKYKIENPSIHTEKQPTPQPYNPSGTPYKAPTEEENAVAATAEFLMGIATTTATAVQNFINKASDPSSWANWGNAVSNNAEKEEEKSSGEAIAEVLGIATTAAPKNAEGGTKIKPIAFSSPKEEENAIEAIADILGVETKKTTTLKNLPKNAEGGLVDYTGLAWVDGTKTKPEAFLSAKDTANIRMMLDAFNTISVNPGIVPDSAMFTDNSTNVGDINITINQAELKSDDDYAKVARRVGQEFSKELKRSGLNLSGYSFS